MDHKISALERAFQLARSGRVIDVDDIRQELRREGYDERAVMDGGPLLKSQLRELIKAAHLEVGRPRPREGSPPRLPASAPRAAAGRRKGD